MTATAPWPAGAKVAVLGAGIVGSACAVELAQAGYSVDLIDRDEPGSGASFGNAGMVMPSRIEPMSDWSLIKSLPMLLLRKGSSPLILRKDYLKQLKPWLKGYAGALRPAQMQKGRTALAILNRKAWDAWKDLAGRAGVGNKLRDTGALVCYSSKQAWDVALPVWEKKQQEYGIEFTQLGKSDLTDYVPCIANSVHSGVLVKADGMISDSKEFVDALVAHASSIGVQVLNDNVVSVARTESLQVMVTTSSGERQYDYVVVALGAWSAPIAASFGEPVDLETHRGYSITYPYAQAEIYYPAVIEDLGLAVTPLAGGQVRIGGWIEFAGLERPPDPDVFARLGKLAVNTLKGLNKDDAVEWMGHRPAMPDSVPVIGPSRRCAQVMYAFGHGHLGVTQAAVTAKSVACTASGESPPVPLDLYSPYRS